MSDNGAVFRTTAAWIKKIQKSQVLQDYLARQQITCSTCLNRHKWGGLYERLIIDVKKMFYKTGGRTSFQYEQVESVVMDIEQHLNNRPWMYMYVENGLEEEQVLMPSDNMYGNGGRENTFMVSWRAIASGGRRKTTQKSRRSYRLSEKKRTGESGRGVLFLF